MPKKLLRGGRALLVALLCACLLALAPAIAKAEGESAAAADAAAATEASTEGVPAQEPSEEASGSKADADVDPETAADAGSTGDVEAGPEAGAGVDSGADADAPSGTGTEEDEPKEPVTVERPLPTIVSWAHVQSSGDQGPLSGADGVSGLVGTSGLSRRLEAFKLSLQQVADVDGVALEALSGSIEYRAYVNGAWQAFMADGALAGTIGRSLPIEGVAVRLTEELEQEYDVYYRVHMQSYGWLAWAKNGEDTGALDFGKRVEALQVVIVKKGDAAPADAPTTGSVLLVNGGVFGTAHCQTYGWLSSAFPGEWIGTSGKSKRLEAVRLSVRNLEGVGIAYQVHGQSYGWNQSWVSDGQTAGYTGQSKRIEAIRIKLTGTNAGNYDVYYRVHCQTLGTLGWAKNGETAGTTGLSLRAEAIQVVVVPKGGAAPGSTSGCYYSSAAIAYASNLAGTGWQSATSGTSGTTGQGRAIYQLKMNLSGSNRVNGTVQYRLHIAGTGWTGWYNEGTTAGTSGRNVQAIQVRLTGTMAGLYDVYYRGHVQSFGWGGWAKNGASAGSTGISKRMEAFQVQLVRKGNAAPGSTANACRTVVMPSDDMGRRAWTQSSRTSYLIMVDRNNCKVGVYTGHTRNWKRIQYWTVSVGAPNTPTVRGTFSVGSRGYSFGSGYTCYYWTQFYGDYLFHSIKYNQGTRRVQDGRLGMWISHGCVRMDINHAKWIYDHIPTGTRVVVY
ncbi:L,D-transpeptidase family protein [Kribbibacterium absianum]|uniref:L,D-transpeptidase family protein n=1 Tax=Kribbibacterium absianum TaxID=3044210 RepID=UPI0024BC5827|nr:L,D-transpeptidase family protein [Olsenella sp. YH-ols2216]MDJ1121982.1 L,D-transpeptidase family protein [Olsenella sp. YH-ols2216]